jgi:hypothetical protein
MLTENDAQRLWQQLFRGQPITALTMQEAGSIIACLPEDSPVRQRLSVELEEVRLLKKDLA